MDIVGIKPTSERGEYFRNNLWWWRPLWDYAAGVAGPELINQELWEHGHYNDGAGLYDSKAKELGQLLLSEIASGRTKQFETDYRKAMSEEPLETCGLCAGTGIRTDAVGVEMGQPTKELEPSQAIALGRDKGWCNGCNGEGKIPSFATNYPFSVENVKEFAEFLVDSGGFAIW
jgi:hypothetical protein